MIDCIDVTGSGDIDTSHTVETEVDGDGSRFIKGLTGSKILIRPEWQNECETWNLGVLDMKKIFPNYVTSRVSTKWKEKHWLPSYNTQISEATLIDFLAISSALISVSIKTFAAASA